MFDLLRKVRWAAVDCLTGESRLVEQLPFEIGSGEGVDLKLNASGVAERHCAINQVKGHGLCLIKQDANLPLFVDGQSIEFCPLAPETDYAVKVGAHFLALRGGRNLEAWLKNLDCTQWTLHDSASHLVDGPMPLADLCQFAKEQQRHPQTLVQPAGLSKGFFLQDAWEVVAALKDAARTDPTAESVSSITEQEPRLLTCPVCWLKFDLGEIMHLATHDSLRGDPVLGEDAPQRFLATRFNDRGQALDALGLPCTEIACPHCRRALPPGFTEMPHHIFSIVGDQSAGKSYYLSVLMKMLPMSLYDNFSVVFQDADPAGNALLNEMKQTLFGARIAGGGALGQDAIGRRHVCPPAALRTTRRLAQTFCLFGRFLPKSLPPLLLDFLRQRRRAFPAWTRFGRIAGRAARGQFGGHCFSI